MKIVLLRHGKPNRIDSGKIKAEEIGLWIESYNSSALDLEFRPTKEAVEAAQHCDYVVCSHLPRSIESANLLAVTEIHLIDEVFREAELPFSYIPWLKLMPMTWGLIFRVLWLCGLKTNSESVVYAKQRAAMGARKLIEIAQTNESVILIGHGFMNRFIAKELLAKGWRGPTNSGKKYWAFGVYES